MLAPWLHLLLVNIIPPYIYTAFSPQALPTSITGSPLHSYFILEDEVQGPDQLSEAGKDGTQISDSASGAFSPCKGTLFEKGPPVDGIAICFCPALPCRCPQVRA